jgi:hypothetical protein
MVKCNWRLDQPNCHGFLLPFVVLNAPVAGSIGASGGYFSHLSNRSSIAGGDVVYFSFISRSHPSFINLDSI